MGVTLKDSSGTRSGTRWQAVSGRLTQKEYLSKAYPHGHGNMGHLLEDGKAFGGTLPRPDVRREGATMSESLPLPGNAERAAKGAENTLGGSNQSLTQIMKVQDVYYQCMDDTRVVQPEKVEELPKTDPYEELISASDWGQNPPTVQPTLNASRTPRKGFQDLETIKWIAREVIAIL